MRGKNGKKPSPKKRGPVVTGIAGEIVNAIDSLDQQVVERYDLLRGSFLAMLARKHVFVLGVKGTAKSMIVERVCETFEGAAFFETLLSKSSRTEDLVGPIKLSGLKRDVYHRNISGMLPSCHVGYIDEIWNAAGATLTALLGMLDERRLFFNADETLVTPIVSVFSSSNVLPENGAAGELGPVYDRFILRYIVGDIIDPSNFRKMWLSDNIPGTPGWISFKKLQQAWADVDAIDVEEIADAVTTLRERLHPAGYVFSPRRWREAKAVMRANAFIEGRDVVTLDDFEVLTHILWDRPQDRPETSKIIFDMMSPDIHSALGLLNKAVEVHREAMASRKTDVGLECNEKFKELLAELGKFRKVRKIEEITTRVQAYKDEVFEKCVGYSKD